MGLSLFELKSTVKVQIALRRLKEQNLNKNSRKMLKDFVLKVIENDPNQIHLFE